MAKTARGLAFASEATQPFGVIAHFRGKHFDRDAIAEQDVARAIDGSHAAFAQERFHLVLAVEHGIDDRCGIGFEYFPVNRTEAHAVVIFCFAGRAVFYSGVEDSPTPSAL